LQGDLSVAQVHKEVRKERGRRSGALAPPDCLSGGNACCCSRQSVRLHLVLPHKPTQIWFCCTSGHTLTSTISEKELLLDEFTISEVKRKAARGMERQAGIENTSWGTPLEMGFLGLESRVKLNTQQTPGSPQSLLHAPDLGEICCRGTLLDAKTQADSATPWCSLLRPSGGCGEMGLCRQPSLHNQPICNQKV
jgi:hypothetical protein